MSNRNVGLFMVVVGSALGAWWLASQRARASRQLAASHERGVVIFDNTPQASDVDSIV